MAFDYGTKRVGVAVTDPLQIIANTLGAVPSAEILAFIQKYCAQETVDEFVVGYPFEHGHSVNEVGPKIEQFIQKLASLYPDKPIHKIDESFTSLMASRTLIESGVSKKKRRDKGTVDSISANILLQTYMELKRS